jgi:hypothetical protein
MNKIKPLNHNNGPFEIFDIIDSDEFFIEKETSVKILSLQSELSLSLFQFPLILKATAYVIYETKDLGLSFNDEVVYIYLNNKLPKNGYRFKYPEGVKREDIKIKDQIIFFLFKNANISNNKNKIEDHFIRGFSFYNKKTKDLLSLMEIK